MIYFARNSDGTGPIKIGCSSAPSIRIRQLESDLRAKFTILAEAPGDFILERNLHLKFAASRIEGPQRADGKQVAGSCEWFDATPELLTFIQDVKATGAVALGMGECREKLFAARYLAGETLQSIATDFGITRERVRQILRREGVTSLGMRPYVGRSQAKARALSDHVVALTKRGRTVVQISRATGLCNASVRRILTFRGLKEVPAQRGAPMKPETLQKAQAIAVDYAAGMKTGDIAKKHGVRHQPTVYRFLALAGVPASRKPRKAA